MIGEISDVSAVRGDAVAAQPAMLTADGKTGILDVSFLMKLLPAPDVLSLKPVDGATPDLRQYGYTFDKVDAGDPLSAPWTFGIPGPTLRFPVPRDRKKAPSRLKLTLYNGLTGPDEHTCVATGSDIFSADHTPNCFHGSDITNIHYHGSHVTPNQPGDDVLVEIPPRGNYSNDLIFTETQPPGTHWYHPHKHGSTALQVGNGLSGALIIEGDFSVKEIDREAVDLVFVMQEVKPGITGGQSLTVNGHTTPISVNMRPGEIQRWRFINAAVNAVSEATLQFLPPLPTDEDEPSPGMYPVAWDGCRFTNARWQDVLKAGGLAELETLAPGNRADFLVVAPRKVGRYVVTHDRAGSQPATPMIAVEVTGEQVSWQLPTELPDLPVFETTLKPIDDVDAGRPNRTLRFSQTGSQGGISAPRRIPPRRSSTSTVRSSTPRPSTRTRSSVPSRSGGSRTPHRCGIRSTSTSIPSR